MSLHVTVSGEGPELVLLHGWGAHSGVWSTVLEELSTAFRVSCIDLPGHGRSPYTQASMQTLANLAETVLEVAPLNASWLGWSLGGLVAQQAAVLAHNRIEKLILLASTPSFVRRPAWPHAVEAKVFRQFHADLIADARATLLRFIALQTRGSNQASANARLLRKLLLDPVPEPAALEAGLELLSKADMRQALPALRMPVLLLAGGRDTLLPAAALPVMTEMLTDARFQVMHSAGHAPFLSHPQEFVMAVENFLTINSTILSEVNDSVG